MQRRSYLSWTFFISVILHGLLGVFLLHLSVAVHPEVPEFVELNVGQISSAGATVPVPMSPVPPSPRPSMVESAERPLMGIPERRVIEVEEPEISMSDEERISARQLAPGEAEKPIFVPRKEAAYGPRSMETPLLGVKRVFDGRRVDVGIAPGSGVETEKVGADVETAFTIEGDVKSREVLSKVLPRYPEDVQKEAVIKLWFTVFPNGIVGEIRPIQKGDTKLENITMAAFKQWRFSALDSKQEQVIQSGEITFFYKLK